jgi:hypothetical protein
MAEILGGQLTGYKAEKPVPGIIFLSNGQSEVGGEIV